MWIEARRVVQAALLIAVSLLAAVAPRVTEATSVRSPWSEIEEYFNAQGGTYGLAMQDLRSGEVVLINADQAFPAASTYKVLVMYRVYEEIESGRLAEDDLIAITSADTVEAEMGDGFAPGDVVTVAEALDAMIGWSSNTASYALARRVGGWSTIDGAATELGMEGFAWGGDYYWTTPRDMLVFFQHLAAGQLVSPSASQRMLRLLERQQTNDRIPAFLPSEAVTAHKTGELPSVRNDVGIVYGPGGSYIICVFSRSPDVDEATSTIAHVSRYAYDHFAR